MSEQIEPKKAAVKALRMAGKMFSRQAIALDRIFTAAILESVPGTLSYHQDMRTALNAQSQYRATMKILLDLEKERTVEERKRENSSKQTIENRNLRA